MTNCAFCMWIQPPQASEGANQLGAGEDKYL